MEPAFKDGVQMLGEGNPRGALDVFERLAQAWPDSRRADVLYNIAICHLRLGARPAALKAISGAVRADPKLGDEIRSDPDFLQLAGDPLFDRALTGAISSEGPAPAQSPLRLELTKTIWKKLVPGLLLFVAAGVGSTLGLPTPIAIGLLVFLLIAVPLSLYSISQGDIEGVKVAVKGGAALGGLIVVAIFGAIALAVILTGLGL